MFGQTFNYPDLATISLLVVLEGVLSIDNALVLGILASRLPHEKQGRALSYGLIGAFIFRLIAIAMAAYLMRWSLVKLLGGLYLAYIAVKHFLTHSQARDPTAGETHGRAAGFWATVVAIELTDIAFAADSILAAIALVGPSPDSASVHPKLWVVLVGGMMGVILMRFAAAIFIKMLERFPRFDTAAYLLVLLIGAKLIVDWAVNSPGQPHRVDFQDPKTVPFWVFWGLMVAMFCTGFIQKKKSSE